MLYLPNKSFPEICCAAIALTFGLHMVQNFDPELKSEVFWNFSAGLRNKHKSGKQDLMNKLSKVISHLLQSFFPVWLLHFKLHVHLSQKQFLFSLVFSGCNETAPKEIRECTFNSSSRRVAARDAASLSLARN